MGTRKVKQHHLVVYVVTRREESEVTTIVLVETRQEESEVTSCGMW